MDKLSTYYRAFLEYRKVTKEKKHCSNLVNSIKSSNTNNDLIEVTKHIFTVDEDWIIAIEEGLVHIEKAIAEERQFIRVNGEVVPIEKAKRVSKDSVSHLSRHSNLITRKVDLDDLVPDQIYTIEKLSDYSVYENRFLYMLLCYLKDFISLRYDKILELSNTYFGKMKMKKFISSRDSKISFDVTLNEERKNDSFLQQNNKSKEIISRIDILLKTVLIYLQTPLMQEVSKASMLKPPITKTNVLKMNKNFKGAVSLYEFISSYDKLGYEIEEQVKQISPFIDEVGEEMGEIIALSSFLTYEHGNGISKLLKENYDKEELEKKAQDAIKYQEQLKALRKRIKETGLGMEDYMLMLEKRNKSLEKDSQQLKIAKDEIEKLNGIVNSLNIEIETLNGSIINLKNLIHSKEEEIEILKQKHLDEINQLKLEYQKNIEDLTNKYEIQIKELNENYQNQINELNESYLNQIKELNESYLTQINELKDNHQNEINSLINKYESAIKELNDKHSIEIQTLNLRHQQEKKEIQDLYDKQVEENKENIRILNETTNENEELKTLNSNMTEVYGTEKKVLLGEINILRTSYGKEALPDEFTTRDKFNELEEELEAFKKIFTKQWQKTKKQIYIDAKKEHRYKRKGKE